MNESVTSTGDQPHSPIFGKAPYLSLWGALLSTRSQSVWVDRAKPLLQMAPEMGHKI